MEQFSFDCLTEAHWRWCQPDFGWQWILYISQWICNHMVCTLLLAGAENFPEFVPSKQMNVKRLCTCVHIQRWIERSVYSIFVNLTFLRHRFWFYYSVNRQKLFIPTVTKLGSLTELPPSMNTHVNKGLVLLKIVKISAYPKHPSAANL